MKQNKNSHKPFSNKYIIVFLISIFFTSCVSISDDGGLTERVNKLNTDYEAFDYEKDRIRKISVITDVFILEQGSDSIQCIHVPKNEKIGVLFGENLTKSLKEKGYEIENYYAPVIGLFTDKKQKYAAVFTKEDEDKPFDSLAHVSPPFSDESKILSEPDLVRALNNYFLFYQNKAPLKLEHAKKDSTDKQVIALLLSRALNVGSGKTLAQVAGTAILTTALTLGFFTGSYYETSASETKLLFISIPEGRVMWATAVGGEFGLSSDEMLNEVITKITKAIPEKSNPKK